MMFKRMLLVLSELRVCVSTSVRACVRGACVSVYVYMRVCTCVYACVCTQYVVACDNNKIYLFVAMNDLYIINLFASLCQLRQLHQEQ